MMTPTREDQKQNPISFSINLENLSGVGNAPMPNSARINILGGGPAGLATAFYATRRQLPVRLFEASSRVGGNAVTFSDGDFRFDSGAHRLHNKDAIATADLKDLLGDRLKEIQIPSQIFHRGRWIDFPLSPVNLLGNLSPAGTLKAAWSLVRSKIDRTPVPPTESFESHAVRKYGREVAARFLLGYSEKLWGKPATALSPAISGSRLKGLSARTALLELFFGNRTKTEHLDGKFLYPDHGFGAVADTLAEAIGHENIRTDSKVTRLAHDGRRILSVEINHTEQVPAGELVSTLPLPLLINLLDPLPDEQVRALASTLEFRNVLLVALFIDRKSVSPNGSVYFPDSKFPFTRVYEPRNRCPLMSPEGKTSLVAEIPCAPRSDTWGMDDDAATELVASRLAEMGWISRAEVIGSDVRRLPHAYPVMELGFEDKVRKIAAAIDPFQNLSTTGRNGLFAYTHVHDMMKNGRELVDRHLSGVCQATVDQKEPCTV